MSHSDNLSTLITIIFGLMLTDLFASIHRLIRHRRRIHWHWLPLLTAWYVLVTILKNWWLLVFREGEGIWESGWIFFFYGHLLLLLFLVSAAVLPDEVPEKGLDLRSFYFDNRRQFWGLLAGVNLLMLIFALLRPVFTVSSLSWPVVWSNLVNGGVILSLALSRRPAYHAVVVILITTLAMLEIAHKF